MRAPRIYKDVLSKSNVELVPLGRIASVSGYIHDNNTGSNFPARRVLWSLRDAVKIHVELTSSSLRQIGIKEDGNSSDYAPILYPRTHGIRHLIPLVDKPILGKEFYKVAPFDSKMTLSICAQLNSTFGLIQREVIGVKGLGGGALKFAINDVKQFLIAPLLDYERVKHAFDSISHRVVLDIELEFLQDDRRQLDTEILLSLGLPASAIDDLYASALELTSHRKTKAKSV